MSTIRGEAHAASAASRLRGGRTHNARGAASFVKEAIGVARKAGAGQELMVRFDSGFYNHKVIGACADAGVYFSLTMPRDPRSTAAIEQIGQDAWTPIAYPQAIWDEQLGCWVSDAEVAETTYTAFASTKRPATARMIVRRVRDKNAQTDAGQGELLPAWRYHAVFTSNPHPLVQAEKEHRKHAIVEQLIADVIDGPLAHLPSGSFSANAAWLTCAAISHNLLRAAGTLASAFHAKARGATLRKQLINVPARLARRLRDQLVLHLPTNWPSKDAFTNLFAAVMHPRPG